MESRATNPFLLAATSSYRTKIAHKTLSLAYPSEPWRLAMDTEEALDLGQHSIEKVSRIATFVGQKKQRIVCGRLGAELFILADYLQGLSDQVDQLLKVPKLLRDIERICCVSARG